MKTSFAKSHLSYEQQVELLKSRNLTIVNEKFAIKKLQHLNYYRLSSYYYPFYKHKDWFKSSVTFEDILQLYYFDKELRHLVFFAIEKIEIYIRTQISFSISKSNDVFAYVDKNIFHNEEFHTSILETITNETKRSKEIFVKEFFNTYDEDYLPVWAMVEIISFNTLSKIFANLKDSYRQEIVKELNIKPFVFQRWLHTLTYIRNICAHHSRLWNKSLAIEPMIPKNKNEFKHLNNQKLFFVLTMIEYILNKINSKEFSFKNKLKALLKKYPQIDIEKMGFIENWENNPIWRDNK